MYYLGYLNSISSSEEANLKHTGLEEKDVIREDPAKEIYPVRKRSS